MDQEEVRGDAREGGVGGGMLREVSRAGRGPAWRRSEVMGGGARERVVGRVEEAATGLAADGAAGGATGLPQKHSAPRRPTEPYAT